jgi:hypothetical protein
VRVSTRSLLRTIVFGLLVALCVPAIAFGQQSGSQSGTTGNGNGSQSGDVSNSQTNSANPSGSGNQINQTNQNCVAGRDCVNNNITNQNQSNGASRVFERTPVAVRAARVRRVHLAFTGFDLRTLFLIGGLVSAGGVAVLMGARRRWSTTV